MFIGCFALLFGLLYKADAKAATWNKDMTLTNDITLSQEVNVVGDVHIDGGGHTIKFNVAGAYTSNGLVCQTCTIHVPVGSSLTIENAVMFDAKKVNQKYGGKAGIDNKGIVFLKDCTIENFGQVVINQGSLNVENCMITDCYTALSNIKGVTNIYGGEYSAGNLGGELVFGITEGELNIYDGVVYDATYGILSSGGTVNIYGGEIGGNMFAIYAGGITNVYGGDIVSGNTGIVTVKSPSYKPRAYWYPKDPGVKGGPINIYGGSISGCEYGIQCFDYTLSIKGGEISGNKVGVKIMDFPMYKSFDCQPQIDLYQKALVTNNEYDIYLGSGMQLECMDILENSCGIYSEDKYTGKVVATYFDKENVEKLLSYPNDEKYQYATSENTMAEKGEDCNKQIFYRPLGDKLIISQKEEMTYEVDFKSAGIAEALLDGFTVEVLGQEYSFWGEETVFGGQVTLAHEKYGEKCGIKPTGFYDEDNIEYKMGDYFTLYKPKVLKVQFLPNYKLIYKGNGGYTATGGLQEVDVNVVETTFNHIQNPFQRQESDEKYAFLGWALSENIDGQKIYKEGDVVNALELLSYEILTDRAYIKEGEELLCIPVYATWDQFPVISGHDFYLEKSIEAEDFYKYVKAEDKEDGPLTSRESFYLVTDLSTTELNLKLLVDKQLELLYRAVDSNGNITEKTFLAKLAGSEPLESYYYVRAIDEENYKKTFEKGGLEDNSVWHTDKSYVSTIKKAFENMKNGKYKYSFVIRY